MILAINQPHFTDDKLQVRADFLAISTIPHLINPATNLAFQQFVQVKSLEGKITCCTEGANFISSQSSNYVFAQELYNVRFTVSRG